MYDNDADRNPTDAPQQDPNRYPLPLPTTQAIHSTTKYANCGHDFIFSPRSLKK